MGVGVAIIGIVALTSGCAYIRRVSSPQPGSAAGAVGTIAASADGRYVAYSTQVEQGDSGDAQFAVHLLDTSANTKDLISVATDGTVADAPSSNPAVSADGRYVAFESDADNLVPNDDNGETDIFVRDRVAHTTTRVSVSTTGDESDGASYDASISSDGRYVAFTSDSDLLDPTDSNGSSDIFVRDTKLGTTTLVSLSASYGQTDSGAWEGVISGDGRYVAFTTDTPLAAADQNFDNDVYVRNLVQKSTVWVSRPRAGFPEGGEGEEASISSDGRYVAFASTATDLDAVPNDVNGFDVFLRDMTAGTTTRISASPTGGALTGASLTPSISADGQRVAFLSRGNASGTDTNGSVGDIFVRDRAHNRTVLVSTDADLHQKTQDAGVPVISADGHYVYFQSTAPFTSDDSNGIGDVFFRAVDVPTITSVTPTALAHGGSATFTITGTTFLPGAQVLPPTGVTASNVVVNGDTSMTVTLTAAANAPLGPQTFYVVNLGTGPGPNSGGTGKCDSCLRIT